MRSVPSTTNGSPRRGRAVRRVAGAGALGLAVAAILLGPAVTSVGQPAPRTGTAWAAVSAVSCPTVHDCMIAGSTTKTAAAASTTDAGTKWTELKLPAGYAALADVHCTGTETCYAIADSTGTTAGAFFITTNFGTSWTAIALPNAGANTFTAPTALACVTGKTCFVVGQASDPFVGTVAGVIDEVVVSGTTAAFTDVTPTSPGSTTLNAIACPSATQCITVGQAAGGANKPQAFYMSGTLTKWTGYLSSAGVQTFFAIDCKSATVCWAGAAPATGVGVGPAVGTITHTFSASSTFKTVTLPKGPQGIFALGCPKTCIAAGYSGHYGTFLGQKGTTWVRQTPPKNAGQIYTMACATSSTTSLCIAGGVNYDGNAGQLEMSKNPTATSPTWSFQTLP